MYVRRFRGMFDAYYKNSEATLQTERGGWHSVGDVAWVDGEGFYTLCDRKRDMIISGGVNIYPAEIEDALHRHPAIEDVAIFGVPDDAMGEELAMVCHPQPGSALTEDELREHLGNALPTFKVPKYLALTDEPLPRNASEKIHRLALRNSFVAN